MSSKEKLNCILLIDDDAATNFVNAMLIERADCSTIIKSVESGFEALDYLKSVDELGNHPQPDLIFLDINMPKMDGWEFIEEYKQLLPEQRGKVLVWMLSTSNNPDDKKRAQQLGSDGFMAKPLTMDKLMSVIRKHFENLFNSWQ